MDERLWANNPFLTVPINLRQPANRWPRDQACQGAAAPVIKRACYNFRPSANFDVSNAQTGDQIQPRNNGGIQHRDGPVAFSGVVDGGVAGAGYDCCLLAGDAM